MANSKISKIQLGSTTYDIAAEPYHVEVTATSGRFSTEIYNSLKGDVNSYILYKNSTLSSGLQYMFKRVRESNSDAGQMLYSCTNKDDFKFLLIQAGGSYIITSTAPEEQSNKVTSITDENKTSTTSYPSVKAVADYVANQGGSGTPTNMVTTDTNQTITGDKTFSGGEGSTTIADGVIGVGGTSGAVGGYLLVISDCNGDIGAD